MLSFPSCLITQASIALITNCDIPQSTAQYLSIVIPIAKEDVIQTSNKQFLTRTLYNAYLPFQYNFILDTHVFPCYNDSYSRLFSLFSKSNVDIAASCRRGDLLEVFGAAVLSKWGVASHTYWKEVYSWQKQKRYPCDQLPMFIFAGKKSIWKYQWVSSNWIWASHGIDVNGHFIGASKCYRSSVTVTGPVMWIHGKPDECLLMNGKDNSLTYKKRVYLKSGKCNMTKNGPMVVESEEDLKNLVAPQKPPIIDWRKNRHPTDFFWNY